jgi:hypothetical protein
VRVVPLLPQGAALQSNEKGIDEYVMNGHGLVRLGRKGGEMATAASGRTPGQMFALVFGVAYALVGILGFVNDPILGIFEVNALHNIVHLAVGAVWIFASSNPARAKSVNLAIGAVYLLLAFLGFVAGDFMEDLLDIGSDDQALADNLLHLVTGVLGVYFGTAGAGPVTRPAVTP